MFTVTDDAANALSEAIASCEKGSPRTLRIAFVDGKYELSLDKAGEGEQVIEHNGQALLVMDVEVSETLSDALLSTEETENGTRLTLTKG